MRRPLTIFVIMTMLMLAAASTGCRREADDARATDTAAVGTATDTSYGTTAGTATDTVSGTSATSGTDTAGTTGTTGTTSTY